MSRVILALAAALCVAAPLAAATSASCTCSGSPYSSIVCQSFQTSCASLVSGASATCTVGVANPTCSASFSGSCPDTTSSTNSCASVCAILTGGSGTWTCSSGSSSCFPANATVELANGATKTMAALSIGDKVRVAPTTFSDVYMFSHRLSATRAEFVTITTTAGRSLMLTPNHYLYVNDKLAVASTVQVGDKLTTGEGAHVAVTAVATAWADGLYNPHTMDGDIVVDGILTSTYTSDVSPSLAHAALWPVRMLHALGQDVVGHAFDSGSELLAAVLPDGKARY